MVYTRHLYKVYMPEDEQPMSSICVKKVYSLSYKLSIIPLIILKVFLLIIGTPPNIDEGSLVGRPDPIPPGNKTVDVATPVYVIAGNDVTIVCNVASGTRPITISWLRNGVEDTSFGNVSIITISNVNFDDNGDMYTCRAVNNIGYDEENTVLIVFGKC